MNISTFKPATTCTIDEELASSPAPTTTTTFDLHDEKPFMKDLLEKHSKAIKSVRKKILHDKDVGIPLWNPEKHDDIWILRYVLSHTGNTKSAAKAALKTMKFRDEMKMDEVFSERNNVRGRCRSSVGNTLFSPEGVPHRRSWWRRGRNSIVLDKGLLQRYSILRPIRQSLQY